MPKLPKSPNAPLTPLDVPLGLFLASALIGVWASYDPATSWNKFLLLVLAVALYCVITTLGRSPAALESAVYAFLLGAALLGVYFVTQHDYAADGSKFGMITTLGLWLNRVTPQLGLYVSHPNIVAGALEIALPINLAMLLGEFKTPRAIGRTLYLAFCLLLSAFALIMTASRGAWLALAIVGAGALALAVARDAVRRYALPLLLIGVLLAATGLTRIDVLPVLDVLVGRIPAGTSAVSRVELFGQAWGLIQDYVYTGAGLGVFPMVLSTYALSLDVPFLTHAHNLYLQIWLEQGMVGILTFVWIVIGFYWYVIKGQASQQLAVNSQQFSGGSLQPLFYGAAASMTVMLLHGFVDVLLYSSRGLPLLFVPMGIAVASGRWIAVSEQEQVVSGQWTSGSLAHWLIGSLVIGLIVISSLIFNPSSLYSNLGAVAQTRIELSRYHWPDALVGNIRRTADLSEAEAYFRQALALDPGNVTANQRLGALALARGDKMEALQVLKQAYRTDPANPVTNRLLQAAR